MMHHGSSSATRGKSCVAAELRSKQETLNDALRLKAVDLGNQNLIEFSIGSIGDNLLMAL